jgi:hypothetical protein
MSTSGAPRPSPGPVDHSGCDFGWQEIRCDRCGREFVCAPWDDLYCNADSSQGESR